jgi:aryl-alcohol dehydrogenase-like predicted oxidoreductase
MTREQAMKQTRKVGPFELGAIGLGAMNLSHSPRPVPPPEQAVATVHAALDAGVTLIDTADVYCPGADIGHNERLIARALAGHTGAGDGVLVATKGGLARPDGGWAFSGTPAHLRAAAQASVRVLGVDVIGLYQLHWPDPEVPFADSVGALAELADAGTIRTAGISNVTVAQLDEASAILGDRLVSVQNPFSVEDRWTADTLERAEQLGLAFLPYSPLAGVSGDGPRAVATRAVATELEVSPQRVALAWLLARSSAMLPIPGATGPVSVRDSAGAAALLLSEQQIAAIDAAPADPTRPTRFAH